ncbi:MAG: acetyl-CoA C-acyltransferase [Bdellovibrionales bacterium]
MGNPRDVVIVDGVRTPFAKSATKLKDVHAAELGKVAMIELIARTNLDVNEVDEVIVGNTGCPSDAVNISRVVALNSGVPQSVSAFTVHRNCASAMESIASGYDRIKAGSADTVLVGGTESMSNMPLIFRKEYGDFLMKLQRAKTMGAKISLLGEFKLKFLSPRISIMEGLTDPFLGINMGQTAENVAKDFSISRKEQDEFALQSHLRAAQAKDKLAEEMTPLFLPPKYKDVVAEDFGPRAEQTIEALQKLRPFFDKKYGTITAGNACPITDGAAMMLLMSREKAESLGYKAEASIKSYAFAGCDPSRMGLGPVYATPKALDKAGLEFKDMGLVELNEAFAAQVIGCGKAMDSEKYCQDNLGRSRIGELDYSKLNVNGGAIALGHPVGTTGTRLVLTLMKEMKRRSDAQFGLATLCIGGGQGGAMIIEKEA